MTCTVPGWGVGPYGKTPWGGSLGATPGGPIPTVSPFDVYCVGPCGPMSVFDTYTEVSEYVAAFQATPTLPEEDFMVSSGGPSLATTTARIVIDKAVPLSWTFEFTASFSHLPPDFLTPLRHVYIGVNTSTDYCAGLMFSSAGIMYTGSVHFDGSNNLVINSPTQILPDSLGLIQIGEYYTFRIVVDAGNLATYIYITKTIDMPVTGHQLKYILPVIPSSDSIVAPVDETVISVRGDLAFRSTVNLDSICLGQGLLIPNLPPVAHAGIDQAVQACSVVRMDGFRSFDPEGTPLTYKWRLIDGPDTSSNVVVFYDGLTFTPSPLTNKLHSATLQTFHGITGVTVGDVITLGSKSYDIVGTGTDVNGFYVAVDGFVIDANQTGLHGRLLRQGTISTRTEVVASFYPDVIGLYRFSLTVFDGQLYSPPSETIVNVTELVIARGYIPDVSFIWGYLSDFWRLVDDRSMITTFWSSIAQVTASELLALWQHDYNKSLRDIQRTFQRKWLHYDLFLKEPYPKFTKVGYLQSGVLSVPFTVPHTGLAGTTFNLYLPTKGVNRTVYFQGDSLSTSQILSQLAEHLRRADSSFELSLYTGANGASGEYQLHITSNIPFALTEGTCPLFTYPSYNDMPRGTGGLVVSSNTFIVPRTLKSAGVKPGDYLIVGGVSYKIFNVLSSSADDWEVQRVITEEQIPAGVPTDWVIARSSSSSYIDFHKGLASAEDIVFFDVVNLATNQVTLIPCSVLSAAKTTTSGVLLHDFVPIAHYLSDSNYEVTIDAVFRRSYIPVSPLVVHIPHLQELIDNKDDTSVLRQNVDYILTKYRGLSCIKFVASTNILNPDVWEHQLPPQRLWAEYTHLDNKETIEENFGLLAEFTLDDLSKLPSDVDYLSAVRGLWFTHFNGPTLRNLRVGSQILLGLPFAEEDSEIVEIRTDFSQKQGRLLLRDTNKQEIVRSYSYPRKLLLEINPDTGVRYTVGDKVKQFAPLIEGVTVTDYVKDPNWFVGYLQQGDFYEVEKFFKFLVRIDSSVFSINTLLFMRSFILRTKPAYTYPLFVINKSVADATVDVLDTVTYSAYINIKDYVGSQFMGVVPILDHMSPLGGTWNQIDSGAPIFPLPTYPTSSPTVFWGLDRDYVCPEDLVYGVARVTFGAPAYPTLDSVFSFDSHVIKELIMRTGRAGMLYIPANPGSIVGQVKTLTAPGTLDVVQVDWSSPISHNYLQEFDLDIVVNNVVTRTVHVSIPINVETYSNSYVVTSLSLLLGDTIKVMIRTGSVNDAPGRMMTILVSIGDGESWALDTMLPAGTYQTEKLL